MSQQEKALAAGLGSGEAECPSGDRMTAPADVPPAWAWKRWLLVLKVLEVRLRFIAVLVITGLVIGYWDTLQNYWDRWTRPARATVVETSPDSEFYCPMHPNVVRPGLDPNGAIPKCPICGMPLSLRKKGEALKLPAGVLSRKQFSPEQIQLAGVKTVQVAYQPLVKEITTLGLVGYDESRLSEITTRVSGYLEKLYVDRTWIRVNEGDPLAEIYSPELYSAAHELMLAQENKRSNDLFLLDLAKSTRERLRLLGISDIEMNEIVAGRANHRLVIRSPLSGHITRKEVKQGTHVEAGQTLFEVADLAKVWIEAEVYEADIAFLREGQAVEATVEASPNRVLSGKVSLVHPHLDSATRTNAVRFELDNPNDMLRPGMFATVTIKMPLSEIEPFAALAAESPFRLASLGEDGSREYFACASHPDVMMDRPGECPKCKSELERRPLGDNERLIWWCPMHPKVTSDKAGGQCDECGGMKLVPKLTLLAKQGEVLVVPERSVIDTGSKKIVYVEREPNVFEGVAVEVGPRSGGFYPVVKGLEPGDRIAERGAFLIDAETRLNPAAAATYVGSSGGPQSGQSAPAASSAGSTVPRQDPQQDDRDKRAPAPPKKPSADDLANLAKLAAEDRDRAAAQGVCPISEKPLGSMGVPYKLIVKGEPVFLCCKGCESEAKQEPDKVLKKLAEWKVARQSKAGTR